MPGSRAVSARPTLNSARLHCFEEGKPFPHVNDAEEFRARIGGMSRMMQAIGYAAIGLVSLLVIGLTIWLLR